MGVCLYICVCMCVRVRLCVYINVSVYICTCVCINGKVVNSEMAKPWPTSPSVQGQLGMKSQSWLPPVTSICLDHI